MVWHCYIDYTIEEIPRAFYVGKGNDARVKDFAPEARNSKHGDVAKIHGCTRKIVFTTDVEGAAYAMEKRLIAAFETFTDEWSTLVNINCNMHEGGRYVPPVKKRQWKTRAPLSAAEKTKRANKQRARQRRKAQMKLPPSLLGRR